MDRLRRVMPSFCMSVENSSNYQGISKRDVSLYKRRVIIIEVVWNPAEVNGSSKRRQS